MVMFDSLNRHMLAPYGCDWINTPNFTRLAKKTVVFDTSYVGSMPCMPARKELHTGRLNFLHRSWSPMEPWDDSVPELMKENGIYSHLVSDHYHYWEDGGATYHTRYSSWDVLRGQEGDPWKGVVKDPPSPETVTRNRVTYQYRHDMANRQYIQKHDDWPQVKTFDAGIDFINTNIDEDNWYLQIETFDPHEPFYAPKEFIEMYPDNYRGLLFDWPDYRPLTEAETPDVIQHIRNQYAALMTLCDEQMGRVLDIMDEKDMWKDTLLIVNTDHGFMLGEHDCWTKNIMPWWEEMARTPLFIWDPRIMKVGERRKSLVTTIDLAATLLEFFDISLPPDMEGKPLRNTIGNDAPVHDYILFGMHGGHINITDGRYVYMRAPKDEGNQPLFNYTAMATMMERRYPLDMLSDPRVDIAGPFSFSKGCKMLKIPREGQPLIQLPNVRVNMYKFGTLLYDLEKDPQQLHPMHDELIEKRMIKAMVKLMKEDDAPNEQYERVGLTDWL
jgi:arylsulfatase A-like enzyme